MLHILLIILKIIGILLAILLAILLLIILAVLFIPVTYEVKAKKAEKDICAKAVIGWLFHAVAGKSEYTKDGLSAEVRILFIHKNLMEPDEAKTVKTEEVKTEETKTEETKTEAEETKTEKAKIEEQKPQAELEESVGKKPFGKMIEDFWNKCKRALSDLKKLWAKIQKILELLTSEATKSILLKLKKHLCNLLHHMRPRRIRGFAKYGFEDPSITGILTGVGYLILPAACSDFKLCPEFEEEVLDCDFQMKGHIRVCHLIKIAVQVFFDKEIRNYIKRVKQLRRNL